MPNIKENKTYQDFYVYVESQTLRPRTRETYLRLRLKKGSFRNSRLKKGLTEKGVVP